MTLTEAKKQAKELGGTIVRTEGGDLKLRHAATGETYFTDCPKDAIDTLRVMVARHKSATWNTYLERKLASISRLESVGFKRFRTESDVVYLRGPKNEVMAVTPTGEAHHLNPEPCVQSEPFGC